MSSKLQVSSDEAPKADAILSQAIISNGLVFVAGQVHNTVDGQLVAGSTEEKLAQIMKNISAILTAANSTLDNAVKVTIYVTDMAQMSEINKHYPSYFHGALPAREAVCVKELPIGSTIEVSLIATT